MQILTQIGDMILQALPVIVLIWIFFLFLKATFFKPIEKILAERSARIEGARLEAERSLGAANEKAKAYQDALKKARAEVYAEQDQLRRKVLDERAEVVREARSRAQYQIKVAKEKIASDYSAARQQVESQSDSLGGELAEAILRGAR